MASKKKRAIVGYPLTPNVLDELGAGGSFSSAPFSPAGNWTNVYRIWACHGYRESGNEDRGTLKIQRSPSQSEDTFTLHVTQKIENDRDLLHTLDAQILCNNDNLATPLQWQTKSEFYDPNGKAVQDLRTEQQGRIIGNTISIETNGKTQTYENARPITGDWCLLEAVQRMPCRNSTIVTMDILKEMALLQRDHQIVYDDKKTFTIGGKPIELYHFQQLGRGMLPYDYWLDKHHRLQVFVTLSIAYICDEKAEQKIV
jgi:hypothetical protein